MAHHLPEYRIVSDREGFFIEDEWGEDVTNQRWQSYMDADDARRHLIADDLANYDGPIVHGWEGGFAPNH